MIDRSNWIPLRWANCVRAGRPVDPLLKQFVPGKAGKSPQDWGTLSLL